MVPPNAIEVEKEILGTILNDNESLIRVTDLLKPESFYSKQNQIIYETILGLFSESKPFDTLSVYNKLKNNQNVDHSYLAKLTYSSSANIEYYAKVIVEKYMLRSFIKYGKDLTKLAQDEGDAFEIAEQAESQIFKITQSTYAPYKQIEKVTFEVLEQIEKIRAGVHISNFLKTGLLDLDFILGGLEGGNLYLLASRPSMGKTGLALTIAENIAKDETVLFQSLEMSAESLTKRLISQHSNLNYLALSSGKFNKKEEKEVTEAGNKVSKLKILIDDQSSVGIIELKSKAKRMKIEKDIKLLIVDYIQLVNAKAESRTRELGKISSGLKSIAKELNIPVLAISQLSRGVEQRNIKRPKLSDLRDSGEIEQDADVVMFIYRPEYYGDSKFIDGSDATSKAEIIISKNRNGACTSIYLHFNSEIIKFSNAMAEIEEVPDGVF